MAEVTLETVNKNVLKLIVEVDVLKHFIQEDFELDNEVKEEIETSRKRPRSEFISHEEIMKEFA